MLERTKDPDIDLVERGPGRVVYLRLSTGERWAVLGTCNCCGLCEVGAENPFLIWQGEPGTPFACIDARHPYRLDVPVTPAFFAKMAGTACTLRLG